MMIWIEKNRVCCNTTSFSVGWRGCNIFQGTSKGATKTAQNGTVYTQHFP